MATPRWTIHHVNLQAHDVRATAAFLTEALGMQEGGFDEVDPDRRGGTFRTDAEVLAVFEDGPRSVHVVKPIPDFARANGLPLNPTVGGHLALRVDDLGAIKARLDRMGWMYADVGRFAMAGTRSIYLYDPSMNVIEVNEAADD